MRGDRRGVRRAAAPVLGVVLLLPIAACGNFTASPDLRPSPFPSAKRPLLQRQAAAIRGAVDGLVGAVPAGGRTSREVIRDHEAPCRVHDPDDPEPAPAALLWNHAVRVEHAGTAGAAERDAALKERLRRDGWRLGDDFGTLIAVRGRMYLKILLSAGTGTGTLVIDGFSGCVRANGEVAPADPPIQPTARPTR